MTLDGPVGNTDMISWPKRGADETHLLLQPTKALSRRRELPAMDNLPGMSNEMVVVEESWFVCYYTSLLNELLGAETKS